MNGGAPLIGRLPCLIIAISLTVLHADSPPVDRAAMEENSDGPAVALAFARSYRGEVYRPDTQTCYPDAKGIPFADCVNIIPMGATLWTPRQLVADFHRRMESLPVSARRRGIIVLLKTERCATKETATLAACSTTLTRFVSS